MKAEESKFAFIIVLPFETNPAQHNGANDGSGIVGPDMQPNLAGQAYQKLYHQVIKTNIYFCMSHNKIYYKFILQEWRTSQTIEPSATSDAGSVWAQFDLRGFKVNSKYQISEHQVAFV